MEGKSPLPKGASAVDRVEGSSRFYKRARFTLRKLYPEWNEDVAIAMKKGRLVWSSSSGEAYYQKISF